jgi:hypothetical protein
MWIMLGLIGLGIAAVAGIVGHTRARSFVGRRLRFTSLVEKPYLGVAAGVTATVVASPLAWLPLVSVGTAIAFGTGVGTGAALGARDAKRPLLED